MKKKQQQRMNRTQQFTLENTQNIEISILKRGKIKFNVDNSLEWACDWNVQFGSNSMIEIEKKTQRISRFRFGHSHSNLSKWRSRERERKKEEERKRDGERGMKKKETFAFN